MRFRAVLALGLLAALALVPARADEAPAAPDLPVFRIDPGDALRASSRGYGPDRGILHVELVPVKQAEFAVFTQGHLGERVEIVVCGQAVSRPTVRTRVDRPDLEILYPARRDADAAAKALAPGKGGAAPGAPLPAPPG